MIIWNRWNKPQWIWRKSTSKPSYRIREDSRIICQSLNKTLILRICIKLLQVRRFLPSWGINPVKHLQIEYLLVSMDSKRTSRQISLSSWIWILCLTHTTYTFSVLKAFEGLRLKPIAQIRRYRRIKTWIYDINTWMLKVMRELDAFYHPNMSLSKP